MSDEKVISMSDWLKDEAFRNAAGPRRLKTASEYLAEAHAHHARAGVPLVPRGPSTWQDKGTPVELDEDGILQCPSCGDQYLHHYAVRVANRAREDGPGTVFRIAEQEVSKHPSAGGFLGRRSDIRIGFWCENCDRRIVLAIVQHKGCTFMYLEPPQEWLPGEHPDGDRP